MSSSDPVSATSLDDEPHKAISPAAQRALAEAAERRRLALEATSNPPNEINGRGGPDPVRYGDWEINGLACDF